MKLIDKYIFKQVAGASILGVLLFIVLWICPEILFRIIKQTMIGEITEIMAVKLFFLEIPEILGKAIPVGLLLGSLFVFDRLSHDFELTIFRGIGVSLKRIAMPLIVLASIGSVFCFITYDRLIPYSALKIKSLKKEVFNQHFVYVNKTNTGKPKEILIITNYDGKILSNIKLLLFSDTVDQNTPMIKNIIIAQNAQYLGDKWVLNNGMNYVIGTDGVYKEIEKFNKFPIFTPEVSQKAYKLLSYSVKKDSEMTNRELRDYLKLLKKDDIASEYRFILNKYYQRFAHAFSCLLLIICGFILGFSKPREKRVIGFTVAALIVFLYYITAPFFDLLAQSGALPPAITAWTPSVLIAISLAFITKRKYI